MEKIAIFIGIIIFIVVLLLYNFIVADILNDMIKIKSKKIKILLLIPPLGIITIVIKIIFSDFGLLKNYLR